MAEPVEAAKRPLVDYQDEEGEEDAEEGSEDEYIVPRKRTRVQTGGAGELWGQFLIGAHQVRYDSYKSRVARLSHSGRELHIRDLFDTHPTWGRQ